jgi:hypothetical protein
MLALASLARNIHGQRKGTTHCIPRSEHRSERARERTATLISRGLAISSLFFVTLGSALQLQASSRHRPIARDRRGSLLGDSSVNKLALAAGIHLKVLSKKIKLRRPLPGGLRPCALHGMKVLLDLKCKGVEILVNEAFNEKRTPLPEHGSRHRQRSSI